MSDNLTPEERSKVMAAIKGKDTKPEIIVRKFLFSKGLRFRIHVKKLHGHPDIVLPKYKTVIFINGCFWHGHDNCRLFKMPSSNIEFWEKKINKNKARDIATEFVLKTQGWRVIQIWECEIRNVLSRNEFLEKLYSEIIRNDSRDANQKPDRKIIEPKIYEIKAENDSLLAAEDKNSYGMPVDK